MLAQRTHGIAMRTIKAKRTEILEAVKKNREKHIVDFKESMEGFRNRLLDIATDAINSLAKQKDEILNGERLHFDVPSFHLREPVSHEKDYNQVISMLEMETSDIIDVKSDEFACYVMDDWDWKADFEVSNRTFKAFVK